MEESREGRSCNFKEKRFQGRLYVGNELVRTLTMQTPPRIGDEILYHDRYDLPLERWLVTHVVWQVTKETEWTWFHAKVDKVDNETWPPIEYPRGQYKNTRAITVKRDTQKINRIYLDNLFHLVRKRSRKYISKQPRHPRSCHE